MLRGACNSTYLHSGLGSDGLRETRVEEFSANLEYSFSRGRLLVKYLYM